MSGFTDFGMLIVPSTRMMASFLHPSAVKIELLDQLNLYCAKGMYQEYRYTNLRRRFNDLANNTKTNIELCRRCRVLCADELGLRPSARLPGLINGMVLISHSIKASLDIGSLHLAELELDFAEENLETAEKLLDKIEGSLQRHENIEKQEWQLQQLTKKTNQLMATTNNFSTTYNQLQADFKNLRPSTIGSLLIDRADRGRCHAEFGPHPASRIPFHNTIRTLARLATAAYRGISSHDVNLASKALKAADRLVSAGKQYLIDLETAVDAHYAAEALLDAELKRLQYALYCHEDGNVNCNREPLHTRNENYDNPLRCAMRRRDSATVACVQKDFGVLGERFVFKVADPPRPRPILHHPRPVSLSPRSMIMRRIGAMP